MVSAALLAVEQAFTKTPAWLISLTVSGDITGSQEFLFSGKLAKALSAQLGTTVLAYLMGGPQGRATRIVPDKAVTERARMTLTFADDPEGPAFDSTKFSITTGGTFWRRLVLAQPDLVGSRILIKRGYVDSTLGESDFETVLRGRVEDFDFLENGNFTLVAKDDFTFADRSVPAQLSDDNKLNGAIIASTTSIVIDKGSELTDPATLSSKDLFPVTLRLDPDGAAEDVIIGAVAINTLTVQANFIDKSEEFDDAAWTKVGGAAVTADTEVGPFGGDPRADELSLPSSGDLVEQDSTEAASGITFVFSVYLKRSSAQGSDASVSVDLILSDATELASTAVTVTVDWQRFEVTTSFTGGAGQTAEVRIRSTDGSAIKILAYGAQLEKASARGLYTATDGNAGAAAGRGAFGSTIASHADDVKIAEVIPYRLHRDPVSGVHPVVILRDFVNRALLLVADIDQTSFDREFNFETSIQFKRAGTTTIVKPRKLSEHIKEVRQQALLDLWVSEVGKVKTRLSFRQNLPGVSTKVITDAENIVHRRASYKGNKQSRITDALVYFNPVAGETDPNNPDDFDNVEVVFDPAVALASGPKARFIFSKWIFRSAEAITLAGRIVSRFKRGARIASWRLELKDTNDFFVGDVIELDSADVPVASFGEAVRGKSQWQIVTKDHKVHDGFISTMGLEFSGLKYAVISPDEDLETGPDPFPDHPDASTAERQFGFIGDAQNNVATALTTAPFTLTTATYTASTKRVFQSGVFASYTFRDGDALFPVHASAHPAFYLIDSKVDDDTIELSVAIKNVSDGVADSGDLVGLANNTSKWRDGLIDGYYIL